MDFLNPSTTEGSLTIGIIGGLISGAIIGFFSGRGYERTKVIKSNIQQSGNGNVALQNSQVGRDLNVRKRENHSKR